MKPLIYAGALYAIVTGGIAIAKVIGGAAWVATTLLCFSVVLAFELHVARSRISNRQCAVLNTILATVFSLLVFLDISVLHRGILKDESVATKLSFAILWVGVPTGLLGGLGCYVAKFVLHAKGGSEMGERQQ